LIRVHSRFFSGHPLSRLLGGCGPDRFSGKSSFDMRGMNSEHLPVAKFDKPKTKTIMPIPTGSKAPDFTLKSKQASGLVDVKLSTNFGKKNTVLLFFPAAFTGVCTKEMCDVSAGLNAFTGAGAEVIGISIDTPFAQEAWAQKEKIGITLASDLNKEIIKKYDVVFPMLAGVGDTAARAAFVIDKNGVVQYSEQTPTPKDLPNFEAIKAALAKLK
jgi:peroxiredoxin